MIFRVQQFNDLRFDLILSYLKYPSSLRITPMMGPPLSFGAPMLGIAIRPGHCDTGYTTLMSLHNGVRIKL